MTNKTGEVYYVPGLLDSFSSLDVLHPAVLHWKNKEKKYACCKYFFEFLPFFIAAIAIYVSFRGSSTPQDFSHDFW